jgi:hypothetical protein
MYFELALWKLTADTRLYTVYMTRLLSLINCRCVYKMNVIILGENTHAAVYVH